MSVRDVLDLLDQVGPFGDHWRGRCPVCGDWLHVYRGRDGKPTATCAAGCRSRVVNAALATLRRDRLARLATKEEDDMGDYKGLAIRLDEELLRRVRSQAYREETSMNAMIVRLLGEYVTKQEAKVVTR